MYNIYTTEPESFRNIMENYYDRQTLRKLQWSVFKQKDLSEFLTEPITPDEYCPAQHLMNIREMFDKKYTKQFKYQIL